MKRKNAMATALAAALLLAAIAGCSSNDGSSSSSISSDTVVEQDMPQPAEAIDIGQGSVSFSFEVRDNEGNTTTWTVRTDEPTVGAALLGVGLIDGDASDYGLMVSHVNGLRADYEEDGAYWAFLIDGEYAMTGVDMTDIEPGKVYAFVYTEA